MKSETKYFISRQYVNKINFSLLLSLAKNDGSAFSREIAKRFVTRYLLGCECLGDVCEPKEISHDEVKNKKLNYNFDCGSGGVWYEELNVDLYGDDSELWDSSIMQTAFNDLIEEILKIGQFYDFKN